MSNDAVLLYDLSEDSITKLDAASNGVANAGAVNGDWVTWQKCGPSACKVFRHQPSTGITTRLRTAAPTLRSHRASTRAICTSTNTRASSTSTSRG